MRSSLLPLAAVLLSAAAFGCSSTTVESSDNRTETNGTTTINKTDTAVEGCGLTGCGAPVELKGTKAKGDACTKGTECAPVQCSCPQPGRRSWYVATCKNAACVDGDDACAPSRDFYCQ